MTVEKVFGRYRYQYIDRAICKVWVLTYLRYFIFYMGMDFFIIKIINKINVWHGDKPYIPLYTGTGTQWQRRLAKSRHTEYCWTFTKCRYLPKTKINWLKIKNTGKKVMPHKLCRTVTQWGIYAIHLYHSQCNGSGSGCNIPVPYLGIVTTWHRYRKKKNLNSLLNVNGTFSRGFRPFFVKGCHAQYLTG